MTPCIYREGDTLTLWAENKIIEAVGLVATAKGVARIFVERDPKTTPAQHEQAMQHAVVSLSVMVAQAVAAHRAHGP